MNISEIAIRRHVFTWMLMLGLILFGAIAFMKMGISQFPDVDFPTVSIRMEYEGASAEVVEKDVVEPIESAIVSLQGIRNISSTARAGRGSVNVEFNLDKDMDIAVQEVQTAVARAQRFLPEDITPPTISKSNIEDRPIMWLSVRSASMPQRELMSLVRDRIKDHFATIDGVSEVMLGGYVDPILRVEVSAPKLARYELTFEDIVASIQREHIELPAGRIETAEREEPIRVLGEATDAKQFSDILIKRRGGSPNFVPLKVGDVAKVSEDLDDIRRKTRVQGVPSIGLGILKQRGANAVGVSHGVREKIKELASQLPEGVTLDVAHDSTTFIEESVNELIFTLALSAALTGVVCWLFLGSWSSTLNILLAIPTSVIGSFIVLKALGFTLNTFTLLGLSLAIGIIVDDAIIVLENIIRYLEGGKSKLQASLIGAREITFAVVATTASLIAIFLPVAFMDGIIGRFFFQFSVTICVAVALSLIEALTLAPMRCSRFLSVGERTTLIGRSVEKLLAYLVVLYSKTLAKALNWRFAVMVLSLLVFAGSMGLIKFLDKEFAPKTDEGSLVVRIQTKEGSSLDFTDQKVQLVEKVMQSLPEYQRDLVSIGGFGGGEVNSAFVFLTLKRLKERPIDPQLGRARTQQEIEDELRAKFKELDGVRAFVQSGGGSIIGGRRGYPIEFSVRGGDWATLESSADALVKAMEESGYFTDIKGENNKRMPEVQVIPDRNAAAKFGVDITDISTTVQALFGGMRVAEYNKGGQRFDILLKLEKSERVSEQDILKLSVRNNRGVLVPLKELVRIQDGESPQTISREQRVRAIDIGANPATGKSQDVAMTKAEELAAQVLPKGYYLVPSGSAETFRSSFRSLVIVMILGIIVAYMVLASQFNSFLDPFIVLLALPFSLSGAFAALYLTKQSLNVYSVIGIILLLGIVMKNSILLVEFTNHIRLSGKAIRDSLMEACPLRLRPILMTSIATIAAAVPPALAIGPGAESRIPMAVVIIGGVAISTIFTLYVVPCFYGLVKRPIAETEREMQLAVEEAPAGAGFGASGAGLAPPARG